MGYENIYATDEDIEKYRLNEVWDKYYFDPWEKEHRFWDGPPELTIDRERGIFMWAEKVGRVSDGTQYRFLLSIRGQECFVYLNLLDKSSSDFNERPFFRLWKFLCIENPSSAVFDEQEIKKETEAALVEYGYSGVRKQVPETIVTVAY